MSKRLMTILLTLVMMLTMMPTAAFAVTGSQVAADGTYSTSITAYKSGKASKTATINVVVVDGLISDLTFSGSDAKDFKKYLMGEKGTEGMLYLDKKASADTVDAVTSATQGGGKYTIDLKTAIKTALLKAEERAEGSGGTTFGKLEDGTYTKDFSAGDGRYNATVTVTVSGGKITDVSVDNKGSGDWSTPLSDAKNNIVGKDDLEGVDAITSATQYSQALEDAIIAALYGDQESEDPVIEKYSAPITAVKPDGSKTKTSNVYVTISNGKISRISFSGGDADDFEKYLKTAKTGSSKYNMSWYEALVGKEVSEDLIVDATTSASLKNESTTSKYTTNLQQALLQALETLLEKSSLKDPEIISGADQTYTIGSGNKITVTSSADFSDLKDVKMDGTTVSSSNYTAKSGSTVVTFESSYLDTLSVGEHTVGITSTEGSTYNAGTATTTLTVKAASASESDAGKTISPGQSATIYVGETLTLNGTRPSSYGNYHYWYTDEEDVDYIEWDIDNSASPSYYAGTNIANITGIAAGTVTVYHQYVSGGSWVDPGETFTITVKEKDGGSGSGSGGTGGEAGDEDPDDPAHVKSISPLNQVADEYTISLNVTGQSKTTTTPGETTITGGDPVDVILLLDCSATMQTGSRFSNMKTQANALIDKMNELNGGSKVAVVAYGQYSSQNGHININTLNGGWTTLSSGASTLKSSISGQNYLTGDNYSYGTDHGGAYAQAQSLMNSVSSDGRKKYIVNISDGVFDYASAPYYSTTEATAMKSAGTKIYYITVGNSADSSKVNTLASGSDCVFSGGNSGENIASAINSIGTTIIGENATVQVPMTGVVIADTLSEYVELSNNSDSANYGVTLSASPSDSDVSIKSVEVAGKEVKVTLNGNLTDDTVYTVNIPVKPTENAQTEANAANTATSKFNSNAGAKLTYQYGTEDAKTIDYEETPQIVVTKKVTLTYDANGGADAPAAEKKSLDATTEKAEFTVSSTEPTREGYTFLGWDTNKDATTAKYKSGDKISIGENTTLFAVWVAQHKVTYNVTGDAPENFTPAIPSEKSYDEGAEVKVADTLTTTETSKDGVPGKWTFSGWNAPSGVTVTGGKFTMPDKGVEFTGTWTFTADKYMVTWKNGDNTLEIDSGVEYNSRPSYDQDNPTKAETDEFTYTFKGWATSKDASVESAVSVDNLPAVIANVTYYAIFEATKRTYTVKFDANDGSAANVGDLDDQSVEYGSKATKPTDPVREDYYFGGWYIDKGLFSSGDPYDFNAEVKKDITLYAKWSKTAARVKFDYNGGKDAENKTSYETDDIGIVKGKVAVEGNVPVPTKDGYTFKEWNTKQDGTGTAVTDNTFNASNGDTVTVYAQWTENEVTITYKATDGGTVKSTNSEEYTQSTSETLGVVNGTAVGSTAKADADNGYEFVNWTDANDKVVSTDKTFTPAKVGNKNVEATYTANFKRKTFTVTWKNYDDSILKTDENVPYGTTPEYKGETPTKAADAQYTYEFSGWSPAISIVTGNVTYTAQYKESTNTYTITWANSDGSELEKDEKVAYGATPSYDGATPTKASTAEYDYSFKEWTPKVETVTGDKTYTATYTETKRSYKIRFVDEDGTLLEEKQVEYGTVPEYTKDDPTKADKVETKNETVAKVDEDGNPVLDEEGNPVTEEETIETNTTKYTFNYWDKEVVAVTGDATYTAKYADASSSSFLVKFVDYNGKVLSKENYANGTSAGSISKPAKPSRPSTDEYSYDFDGWSPSIEDVTGSRTYTATYKATKRKYTITFKDEDGTVLGTQQVEYGTVPVYSGKTPTKDSTADKAYSFSNWSPALKEVTDDAEYTAQYSEVTKRYTVTWNNYDGSNLETDKDVLYGTTPSYGGKTPTRPETDSYTYTFSGWSPSVSSVTGNVTYTAVFKETRKTVASDNDDDSEATTDNTGGNNGGNNGGGGNGNRGGNAAAATATAPAANGTPANNTANIADNNTPQAQTPAAIEDNDTPLASGEGEGEGAWALINLICAVLATIGAALAAFRKRDDDEYEDDDEVAADKRKARIAKGVGIAAAVASILAFILTEDMSAQMSLVDHWTLLMAALLAGQAVTAGLTKKYTETEYEEVEEE